MRFLRPLGSGLALAAVALVPLACSSDELPSKSEFVDQLTSESDGLIDKELAGCLYDELKPKEAALKAMYDEGSGEGSDFDAAITEATTTCMGLDPSVTNDSGG